MVTPVNITYYARLNKISDGIYLSHRLRKELSVSEIEQMSESNALGV
jgi:hypothetical protein